MAPETLPSIGQDAVTAGWVCGVQDRLFKGTQMTIYNQSLYVALFSAIISLTGWYCISCAA